MSRFLMLASVAAVIAVAVGVFANAAPRPSGVIGVPAVTPDTATPSPSPFISTADWLPLSSTRYGYEIAYPPNWTARQSVRAWSIDYDKNAWNSPAADHLDGGDVLVTAFAADIPPGTSADAWISSYLSPEPVGEGSPSPCTHTSITLATTQVDGHPVAFWREDAAEGCAGTFAFVVVDGRIHVFSIWRSGRDALLEAMLSTVTFGTGALDTSTWTTYSSARYTFGNDPTIGHPADWVVRPSDHDWTFDSDGLDPASTGLESFTNPEDTVRVSAWNVPRAPSEGEMYGATASDGWRNVEPWVQSYCERTGDTPCTGIHQRAVPLCLENRDCHPGLLVPFQNDVQAFFTNGGKGAPMTVVAVWRGPTDPTTAPYGGSRQLLEAFLSTMDVQATEESPFQESRDAAASFAASAP